MKLFSPIELSTLLADREWLDEATKTIGQYRRRKSERRHGRLADISQESESGTAPITRYSTDAPSSEPDLPIRHAQERKTHRAWG